MQKCFFSNYKEISWKLLKTLVSFADFNIVRQTCEETIIFRVHNCTRTYTITHKHVHVCRAMILVIINETSCPHTHTHIHTVDGTNLIRPGCEIRHVHNPDSITTTFWYFKKHLFAKGRGSYYLRQRQPLSRALPRNKKLASTAWRRGGARLDFWRERPCRTAASRAACISYW